MGLLLPYIYPKGKCMEDNDEDLVWKFASEQENFKSNMRNLVRRKKLTGEKWRESTSNASIL